METSKSLLTTAGISLMVSTAVVLVNNYFFYKYVCKKQSCQKESCQKESCQKESSQNVCRKEVCDF